MGLKLKNLPRGTEVYIDANIFLYSAFKHPIFGDSCINFLIKVDEGVFTGYVSDHILNEVFHKLMVAEVSKKFKMSVKNAIKHVNTNPNVISNLETVWEEMDIIRSSNIQFLDSGILFPIFVRMSKRYNLMATDAIHVAIMKKHNIANIATNDSDFERVEWIKVWKP